MQPTTQRTGRAVVRDPFAEVRGAAGTRSHSASAELEKSLQVFCKATQDSSAAQIQEMTALTVRVDALVVQSVQERQADASARSALERENGALRERVGRLEEELRALVQKVRELEAKHEALQGGYNGHTHSYHLAHPGSNLLTSGPR